MSCQMDQRRVRLGEMELRSASKHLCNRVYTFGCCDWASAVFAQCTYCPERMQNWNHGARVWARVCVSKKKNKSSTTPHIMDVVNGGSSVHVAPAVISVRVKCQRKQIQYIGEKQWAKDEWKSSQQTHLLGKFIFYVENKSQPKTAAHTQTHTHRQTACINDDAAF